MASLGYYANTATVGNVSDKILLKPSGSGNLQITPTIPGAVFQSSNDTDPAPKYTKSSSTVLVFTMASTPGFTTSSKAGVFWDGGYVLGCTITSVTGDVVTITTPGSIPGGMSDFTGVTPGTTVVTLSIATIATGDLPNNPDLTDYTIDSTAMEQLLVTCSSVGGFEFFISGTLSFYWNYASAGDFYNFIVGDSAPWSGVVDTIRFYNASTSSQTMSVGAIMN